MGRTGAYGQVLYAYESSFKGGATGNKTFGRQPRITSINARNNLEKIYDLGTQYVTKGWWKNFETSISMEWILANPWFLKGMMAGTVTDGGSGPYIHTFAQANTAASFEMDVGMALENDNPVTRQFTGCIFNNVTLSTAVNDMAKVRADIWAAAETDVSTALNTYTVDTFDPYAFVQGNLSITGSSFNTSTGAITSGTTIAEVQSFELSFNRNNLGIWGVGSANANSQMLQAFDITGRMSVTLKGVDGATDFVNYVNSRAEVASASFYFSNDGAGAATTSSRRVVLIGTGLLFDEHTHGLEPNALILEDIPFTIRQMAVYAVDDTSTMP